MECKKFLKELEKDYNELLASPLKFFNEVKNLEEVGVYLVCDKSEIVYVGSTNSFNLRFGSGLLHKTTHTLHRKLLNEGRTSLEICSFLKEKCRYKIKICESKLKAEALEHFAIWLIKPKYNKNIYQKKSSS